MQQSLTDAILHAYRLAKPHLLDDDLPGDLHIQLLVRCKLGDLRELDLQRNGKDTNTTILSGG